jgi:phosphohistidine phosphatase SixA
MQRRALLNWLAATTATYALPTRAAAAPDHAALVTRMRQGGHIILIRHAATVPGVGDPDGFVLTQCASQRNLSDQGRADAMRIGEAFVRLGIPVADVLSSRWCRCLDTARLAFGRVTPAPMLDSMFRESADGSARKQSEVASWLSARHAAGNVVMVTHDVNIQALAGRVVRQGEMVLATSEQGILRVEGVFTL